MSKGAFEAVRRCRWATTPEMIRYHDQEWGVAVHDERRLFEFLVLEGAQAGLSWETILRKRERYRQVFYGFDPQRVARMSRPAIEKALRDPGIVRNRAKVESTVGNAKAFLAVAAEFGSFDAFIWQFTGGKTLHRSGGPVPASSSESESMSKELRKRGFRFVGPTICYAFMQATGMVDDHADGCHRGARR